MPVIWKPRRKKTKAGLPENYHDKKNGVSNLWSEKNKREALYLYLASGNMTEVSQLLNIPYVTLKWWKSSDWWQQELEKVRDEERQEMLDAYKRRAYFYRPYKRKVVMVLNTEELATMYHLPGGVAATPTFTRIESKKAQAPTNLPV